MILRPNSKLGEWSYLLRPMVPSVFDIPYLLYISLLTHNTGTAKRQIFKRPLVRLI